MLPHCRSFSSSHHALIIGRMIAIGVATIARNGRVVLMAWLELMGMMQVYVGNMQVCVNDCVSSSRVEGRELGILIFNVESKLIKYSILIMIRAF
jgi:hypothetical protein